MALSKIMREYQDQLVSLDRKNRRIKDRYASGMSCGKGCCRCCQGLFDVTLPDAVRISSAFGGLSADTRTSIAERAARIHGQLLEREPGLQSPFFLAGLPNEAIDLLAERFAAVRCPFLDEHDYCLIYDGRPLACILEGLPMVDCRDGLFDDWCELNFREGISAELVSDVQLDYYGIRDLEQETARRLLPYLPGSHSEDSTTFIPSIICSFDSFWKERLD